MSGYLINYIAPELQSSTSISPTAKCILGRIGGLTKKGTAPCYASNEYLAHVCGVSYRSVQRALNDLEKDNIISTDVTLEYGKKKRYIYLVYEPLENRAERSVDDNLSDNLSTSDRLQGDKMSKNSDKMSETSDKMSLSSIHRSKEKTKDREKGTLSDFSSVLNEMRLISNELKDLYFFNDSDLQDDAKSYLTKFKGIRNRESVQSWMLSGYAYRKQHDTTPQPIESDIKHTYEALKQFDALLAQDANFNGGKEQQEIEIDCEVLNDKTAPKGQTRSGLDMQLINN